MHRKCSRFRDRFQSQPARRQSGYGWGGLAPGLVLSPWIACLDRLTGRGRRMLRKSSWPEFSTQLVSASADVKSIH